MNPRGSFLRRRRSSALMFACVASFLVAFLWPHMSSRAATGDGAEATTTAVATAHAPATAPGAAHGSNTLPNVLLILVVMILLAKLGGDLFERIGQPAVLGELIFGILLGNLTLLKLHAFDAFVVGVVRDPQVGQFITILAEIGVILLLFEVGLEATVSEMVSVGVSSFIVAMLGVIVPIGLGFVVGQIFLPDASWMVHLFLGAVLAATSVGITARVLRDLGKMHLREAKIVLGAAVIDDILGLVVLAVVQGIIEASNAGTTLSAGGIGLIIIKAIGFFITAIVIGLAVSKRLFRWATFLHVKGVLLSLTLVWCFAIAYLGTLFGLAPIVGAFAAGLVLEDATFQDWKGRERQLEELLRPITTFLVPVFFVHMGMKVDLSTFGQVHILGFAAALTIAAIIGKQVCALGPLEKGLNRLAIGVGMVPRGEVGLIVANIGLGLVIAGKSVISPDTFSATVIMVVITTMVTPPVLKWALERKKAPPVAAS